MTKLSNLENAALFDIAADCPTLSRFLSLHVSDLTVKERRNSGAGHYTEFNRISASELSGAERIFGIGLIEIEGLESGVGAHVILDDGFLDTLEMYSFGESTEAIDFVTVDYKVRRE